MSYTNLVHFVDGKATDGNECQNAWGGAARIWTDLFDQYVKDPSRPYDSWMVRDKDLWPLAKRSDLPEFERAVLAFTYDYAIVTRKDFARLAAALREFAAKYPKRDRACHLEAWANEVEQSDAEAVGLYGTSVSENLWFTYDEERDECAPYDLATGDKHWDVYAELAAEAAKGGAG